MTRSEYVLDLGGLSAQEGLSRLDEMDFSRRLAGQDPTLWPGGEGADGASPERMGWVSAPARAAQDLERWKELSDRLLESNPRQVFLMGMGGSSVFSAALASLHAPGMHRASSTGAPELVVLDNLYPSNLAPLIERFAEPDSLILVASKSGTTLETRAMATLAESVGAAPRMVAITDPGTPMDLRAQELGYAAVLHGYPDVGGRFSALTPFGLFPALLTGGSVDEIIDSGMNMMDRCGAGVRAAESPGAVLGAAMAALVQAGGDIVDIFSAAGAGAFNGWVEQLVAESTGKEGLGVWPRYRSGDSSRPPGAQDNDAGVVVALGEHACPNSGASVTWSTGGASELGAEVVRWEVATAALAALMGIPPFSEPDVSLAKELTSLACERLERGEGLPWPGGCLRAGRWSLFSAVEFGPTVQGQVQGFLELMQRAKGALSLLTYLPQTDISRRSLAQVAAKVERRYGTPVLLGYGPQYLHASGQLHKGGSDRASHLVLTADSRGAPDLPPYKGVGFGELALAQALADVQALTARGRSVLHLHFHGPHSEALGALETLI